MTPLEKFYSRNEGMIQILTLILIPMAVFLYGQHMSNSIERTKTRQEYVRIATGILSQPVKKEVKESEIAVRTWAVELLQEYSPVKMTQSQMEDLIDGAVRPLAQEYSYTVGYPDYSVNDYPANWDATNSITKRIP